MANSNDRDANSAPPLPEAQDAGRMPQNPHVQTRPPLVRPPLTSSTGTGFNAADAGTGLAKDSPRPNADAQPMPPAEGPEATVPQPGNIDRDALAGADEGPGSQADAEEVSSTGPVSG